MIDEFDPATTCFDLHSLHLCLFIFVSRLLEASYKTQLCSSYRGRCKKDSDCQSGNGKFCKDVYCHTGLDPDGGGDCLFRKDFPAGDEWRKTLPECSSCGELGCSTDGNCICPPVYSSRRSISTVY